MPEPRQRVFDAANVFRGGRRFSLRSRFLAALLAVIVVAETAIAVAYYNQRQQHSITEQLVSLGQRMHHMADFQFGVAQLALQPSPVRPHQIYALGSMLTSSEAAWLRVVPPRDEPAVHLLRPRFETLARMRVRLDNLPSDSPQRRVYRHLLIDDARRMMVTTNQLHHAIDTRILAAQTNAESGEDNAFRTFLFVSAIPLAAAIALALLLARAISRPVVRLAAGAQQRRMLLSRVITAQEEERRRISRELHDEAGQSLTALGLGLEAATAELQSGQRQSLDRRLRSLTHVAHEAIEGLDRLVLDLRPAQLDHLGLVATLRWYVARVRSQSGVTVRLAVEGQAKRLEPEVETALFRIAQEALTNVVRHAGASLVEVVLSFESDSLSLEVTDNGVGFDAEATGRAPSSVGLIGMRERADLVGGVLVVRSWPGKGTKIGVTVPLGGERL